MSAPELNSCLYDCSVMHHRLAPKQHHFDYGIFQFCLDLDELDTLSTRLRFFHRNRPALYRFNDADHLPIPKAERGTQNVEPEARNVASHLLGAKATLLAWIASQGLSLPPDTRVLLLTHCRVFGYIFNPVSFYFCSDATGAPLCAVVEVGNTFRELKPYLLRAPESDGRFRLVTPKHFYVSPFSALDLCFDFNLRVPAETLELHIDDRAGERPVLLSALTGRRAPLTTARLLWFTLKYPLITLKVITLIHWHALLLRLRGLPWHRKSAHAGLQRDVFHPHSSIAPKTP